MTSTELEITELLNSDLVNRIAQGCNAGLSKEELGVAIKMLSATETLKGERVATLMGRLQPEERALLTEVLALDSEQANLAHVIHKSKGIQVKQGGDE